MRRGPGQSRRGRQRSGSPRHATSGGQSARCPWMPRLRPIAAARRRWRPRPAGAARDRFRLPGPEASSSRGTRKIACSISWSSSSAARHGGLRRSSRSRRARVARRRSNKRLIVLRCRSSITRSALRAGADRGEQRGLMSPHGPQSTRRARRAQPDGSRVAAQSRFISIPLRARCDREPGTAPCYPSNVLCGWSCEAGVPVP